MQDGQQVCKPVSKCASPQTAQHPEPHSSAFRAARPPEGQGAGRQSPAGEVRRGTNLTFKLFGSNRTDTEPSQPHYSRAGPGELAHCHGHTVATAPGSLATGRDSGTRGHGPGPLTPRHTQGWPRSLPRVPVVRAVGQEGLRVGAGKMNRIGKLCGNRSALSLVFHPGVPIQ